MIRYRLCDCQQGCVRHLSPAPPYACCMHEGHSPAQSSEISPAQVLAHCVGGGAKTGYAFVAVLPATRPVDGCELMKSRPKRAPWMSYLYAAFQCDCGPSASLRVRLRPSLIDKSPASGAVSPRRWASRPRRKVTPVYPANQAQKSDVPEPELRSAFDVDVDTDAGVCGDTR